MIDLEKLREIAETVETEFFTINADEVLELLDHIASLEKDAGRIEAFAKAGAAEDCAESDAFYEAMDGFRERENDECPASYMRAMIDAGIVAQQAAIDTAMESKHG